MEDNKGTEDFKDKKDNFINKSKNNPKFNEQTTEKIRVKLPKNNEVLGIIEQRLGGNKMKISCLDGKSRICRVPGRLRRRLWLRMNDVVIVEPWELDNSKGDVLFKYKPNQIQWLRKNGYLEKEEIEF